MYATDGRMYSKLFEKKITTKMQINLLKTLYAGACVWMHVNLVMMCNKTIKNYRN